ncbi:MAG: GntR family transcriptional regulator [Novosphingobium sp.]|nr:GntR family transcriptional regulator [Novosphingobium sp.]
MSPSHVFEPTYAELRSRIVGGVWPPGARLEANRLADDLGVSMTPVRDSLNRLVGERLVELEYGHGFCVARMGEQDLRDLLSLNLALLLSASMLRTAAPVPLSHDAPAGDFAVRTARVFEALAAASGNPELGQVVRWLNDRLHSVRRHDETILLDTAAELAELEASVRTSPSADLAARLIAYHDRRRRCAPCYLRRIERGMT